MMSRGSPEFWAEVQTLFAAAMEVGPSERARFLDERCGSDPQVRAEIESLLDAEARAEGFLAGGGTNHTPEAAAAPPDETGRVIGPFRLVEKIGEGGMSVVYRAQRVEGDFAQQVAVKLIDAPLRNPEALRRFRIERHVLAALHHPHIVTLLDGGVTEDGRSYLIMEYVEGVPIAAYCREHALSLEERLRLVRDLCGAVQHAHERGIVHRDLKPANILVADGAIKVLDFGIAKLLDASRDGEVTREAARALTPNYASPEQLRGLPVTTASDVYALGVLFYELLAGVRPYETTDQTLDRILAIVVDKDPRPPSACADPARIPYEPRRLRGDLDAIALKALRKDPAHRYASAHELSRDIGRHLAEQPVQARRGTLWYRGVKRLRRHAKPAALSAVVLIGVLLLALVGTWGVNRESTPSRGGVGALAVLPMSTAAEGPDLYLANGITDALIGELSQVKGLRVIARGSVMGYRGASKASAQVIRELSVDALVTGRVERPEGRVRLTLSVTRAGNDRPTWSHVFEDDAPRIAALEHASATAVSEALGLPLTVRRAGSDAGRDPRAYEAYLRGRFLWDRRASEADLTAAVGLFRQALDIDPAFAAANAGIADAYLVMGDLRYGPPADAYQRAKDATARALELDDALPEAHRARAWLAFAFDRDWGVAEREFLRAIELNPSDGTAHQWYAEFLLAMGRSRDALASIDRAIRVDPKSPMVGAVKAWLLYLARDYQTAIDQCDRVLATDASFLPARLYRAWSYTELRQFDAARRDLEVAVPAGRISAAVAARAVLDARTGHRREAEKLLDELQRRSYAPSWDIAKIYVSLGRTDDALLWLERAYGERAGVLLYASIDPQLDELRDQPRFRLLIERLGLPRTGA